MKWYICSLAAIAVATYYYCCCCFVQTSFRIPNESKKRNKKQSQNLGEGIINGALQFIRIR